MDLELWNIVPVTGVSGYCDCSYVGDIIRGKSDYLFDLFE